MTTQVSDDKNAASSTAKEIAESPRFTSEGFGHFAEPPTKKEDTAPSTEITEPKTEEVKEAKAAPAPEPEKTEPKRKDGESRKAELAAEIQELLRKRAELRKDLEKKDDKSAPSADEKKPEALKKPVLSEFQTYEEYEAAKDTYYEKLALRAKQEALDEFRQETEKREKQSEADKQAKTVQELWKERVTAASKKHDDFAEIALSQDLPIPQGSVMDHFILESDQGAEVLYHLAKNPGELDRIAKLAPLAQARELFKIEVSMSEPAVPTKKTTSAPKPPVEVGGKGTPPEDQKRALLEDAVNGNADAISRYLRS